MRRLRSGDGRGQPAPGTGRPRSARRASSGRVSRCELIDAANSVWTISRSPCAGKFPWERLPLECLMDDLVPARRTGRRAVLREQLRMVMGDGHQPSDTRRTRASARAPLIPATVSARVGCSGSRLLQVHAICLCEGSDHQILPPRIPPIDGRAGDPGSLRDSLRLHSLDASLDEQVQCALEHDPIRLDTARAPGTRRFSLIHGSKQYSTEPYRNRRRAPQPQRRRH